MIFDNDYVFTVTHVLLHGVPYFVLAFRDARARVRPSLAHRTTERGVAPFAMVYAGLALPQLTHDMLDRFVWRVRSANPVLRRKLGSV